jgi:ABC-type dipeptide/oligopeptide/nickel transport system permease component
MYCARIRNNGTLLIQAHLEAPAECELVIYQPDDVAASSGNPFDYPTPQEFEEAFSWSLEIVLLAFFVAWAFGTLIHSFSHLSRPEG